MTADSSSPRRFNIALSFPGQHRRFVKNVATRLREVLGDDCIFYDEWYEPELLGLDGDLKLRRYYRELSQMVVPFFSEHYEKDWCQIEWSAIRAMLKARRKEDAVIPVQLDGTRIEGWEEVDFAIRKKSRSGRQIADLIIDAFRHRFPAAVTPNIGSGIHETSTSPPLPHTVATPVSADRLRNLHQRFVEAQDRFPREVSFAMVMIPHDELRAWKEAKRRFDDFPSGPPKKDGSRCLAFAGGGDVPETITIPVSEWLEGATVPVIYHLDSWKCWLMKRSTTAPFPSSALDTFRSLASDACRLLDIRDCGMMLEGQRIGVERGKYQHLLRWSLEQLPAEECHKMTWLDPPNEHIHTNLEPGHTPRRWVVEQPCVFAMVAHAIERRMDGLGNPWPTET